VPIKWVSIRASRPGTVQRSPGGELIGHALYESLPEWETVLLFDLSVIGLLVGLFSPILFGIVMPLLD